MSNDESKLWDKKYKTSRIYNSEEEVFQFSKNNPTVCVVEPYIKDGMSVLEVGSGTGELILYLAKKYPSCRMHGLDFSTESVMRSKEIANKFNIPVSFAQGDIQKMPFADESFDIIFGDQVIGHIENQTLALREIYRVTKNDGIVAFSTANSLRPDGWYLSKILSRSHQGYKQKGSFPWTLKSKLKKAGFKPMCLYGEMLVLFRVFSIIKSFFKKNRVEDRKVSNPVFLKHSESKKFFKKVYYFLDKIFPVWSKVTIGLIARK